MLVARRRGNLPGVEATILRQTDNDKHALDPAAALKEAAAITRGARPGRAFVGATATSTLI
jgi:hypothetical protein